MKKLNLNFPVFLILFGIIFGCAQETKDENVEADISAIKELYNQYCLGANNDDLDFFISLWADDATRMESGFFPIVGKENIRHHFQNIFNLAYWHVALYGDIEVQLSDDLAFARGAVTISGTFKEDSSESFTDVKWLDILKRQDDGSWKIYIDCVNNNPLLSEEPAETELGKDQDMTDPIL
jgi:uncharacterized protein (TIGR02246 family)